MLPIAHYRRVLGPDCLLTDMELEVLREQSTAFAEIIVEAYLESRKPQSGNQQESAKSEVKPKDL